MNFAKLFILTVLGVSMSAQGSQHPALDEHSLARYDKNPKLHLQAVAQELQANKPEAIESHDVKVYSGYLSHMGDHLVTLDRKDLKRDPWWMPACFSSKWSMGIVYLGHHDNRISKPDFEGYKAAFEEAMQSRIQEEKSMLQHIEQKIESAKKLINEPLYKQYARKAQSWLQSRFAKKQDATKGHTELVSMLIAAGASSKPLSPQEELVYWQNELDQHHKNSVDLRQQSVAKHAELQKIIANKLAGNS